MNNYAVIGKLKLQEIEGAKTLQMGFYDGMPFAVQKDLTEDDLCIIFLPDGQLSKEYAEANDCVQRIDENGNRAGGFFGKNRKVRSVKFMQGKIRSLGYVAKIDTLAFTGLSIDELSKLKEGQFISDLNGVPIANKFINQATRSAMGGQKGIRKERELLGLKMHPDTSQYYQNKTNFKPGDLVTWTEKLDGTSVRFGEVYDERKLNWAQRLLNKITPLEKYQKKFVTGTRRVLLSEDKRDTGFYENDNIYKGLTKSCDGKLHQGEAVYAEIVGWQSPEKPLFERGGVKFTYGCQPGERTLFVYKIVWTLPGGEQTTLSWDATKARATELGLKYVPELGVRKFGNDAKPEGVIGVVEKLTANYTIGLSTLDQSHIREGCAIRVDRGQDTFIYKSKSEEYYMLEDVFKADDKNVDLEEAQG